MDPTETLRRALTIMADADPGACKEDAPSLLRDLADWMERGGFAPSVHLTVDKMLAVFPED